MKYFMCTRCNDEGKIPDVFKDFLRFLFALLILTPLVFLSLLFAIVLFVPTLGYSWVYFKKLFDDIIKCTICYTG